MVVRPSSTLSIVACSPNDSNPTTATVVHLAATSVETPTVAACRQSLSACTESLRLPHIQVTGPDETWADGTILGPFFPFQVLSNGPDRSRLLSNGTHRKFPTIT